MIHDETNQYTISISENQFKCLLYSKSVENTVLNHGNEITGEQITALLYICLSIHDPRDNKKAIAVFMHLERLFGSRFYSCIKIIFKRTTVMIYS